jgi:hypothetical protein
MKVTNKIQLYRLIWQKGISTSIFPEDSSKTLVQVYQTILH